MMRLEIPDLQQIAEWGTGFRSSRGADSELLEDALVSMRGPGLYWVGIDICETMSKRNHAVVGLDNRRSAVAVEATREQSIGLRRYKKEMAPLASMPERVQSAVRHEISSRAAYWAHVYGRWDNEDEYLSWWEIEETARLNPDALWDSEIIQLGSLDRTIRQMVLEESPEAYGASIVKADVPWQVFVEVAKTADETGILLVPQVEGHGVPGVTCNYGWPDKKCTTVSRSSHNGGVWDYVLRSWRQWANLDTLNNTLDRVLFRVVEMPRRYAEWMAKCREEWVKSGFNTIPEGQGVTALCELMGVMELVTTGREARIFRPEVDEAAMTIKGKVVMIV